MVWKLKSVNLCLSPSQCERFYCQRIEDPISDISPLINPLRYNLVGWDEIGEAEIHQACYVPAQKDTFTSLNNFFSFFFPQKQLTDRFQNDIISLWNYQGRSWRHSKSGSGPLVRLPYILLLSLLSTELFLFWIHQCYNIADVQTITCIVLIDIFDINWNSTWKRKEFFLFIHFTTISNFGF